MKTILNRYLFPHDVWNKPCSKPVSYTHLDVYKRQGFRGEVTGTAHHPTNPIVDIVQAERASYYLFRRTEQAACQIIGNDLSLIHI